jgi:hypothetical protein
MAVIVVGKLADNSYTRDDDTLIRRNQLIATRIAVDLSAATAKVTKANRGHEPAATEGEVVTAD